MDDALAVGGVQCIDHGEGDIHESREAYRPACDLLLQRLSLEQLHREKRRIAADVMNGADVGVVERGCGTRFALEAFKRQLGYRCSAWQDLDGHHTPETRVRRPIHLTHPSAAERRDDLVGAEARAGSQRHEWIGALILVGDPVRGKGKATDRDITLRAPVWDGVG